MIGRTAMYSEIEVLEKATKAGIPENIVKNFIALDWVMLCCIGAAGHEPEEFYKKSKGKEYYCHKYGIDPQGLYYDYGVFRKLAKDEFGYSDGLIDQFIACETEYSCELGTISDEEICQKKDNL